MASRTRAKHEYRPRPPLRLGSVATPRFARNTNLENGRRPFAELPNSPSPFCHGICTSKGIRPSRGALDHLRFPSALSPGEVKSLRWSTNSHCSARNRSIEVSTMFLPLGDLLTRPKNDSIKTAGNKHATETSRTVFKPSWAVLERSWAVLGHRPPWKGAILVAVSTPRLGHLLGPVGAS